MNVAEHMEILVKGKPKAEAESIIRQHRGKLLQHRDFETIAIFPDNSVYAAMKRSAGETKGAKRGPKGG